MQVLESTLEWLQAHAFRTLTSYTAEGTAGWLPQMLLPHAPGFWHDEDTDEADAYMANAMTRTDVRFELGFWVSLRAVSGTTF